MCVPYASSIISLNFKFIVYLFIGTAVDSRLLQSINRKLDYMTAKVDKLDWIASFREGCPWLDMAETERSRVANLRSSIFKQFGLTDATVKCWLLGINCPVKVAHILPNSTNNKVLKRLGLSSEFKNQINPTAPNFMIINSNLEEAFDSMDISFCPPDLLNPTRLQLKLWNQSIRDNEVVVGITFGSLEGAFLSIPENWHVSLRCFSYHNLCCYIYHKYNRTLSLDEDMPADFSSQFGVDKDETRRYLASLFHSTIRVDKVLVDESEDSDDNSKTSEKIPEK